MSKACSKCKEVKDVSYFGSHKGHKDGLSSQCKTCINKRNTEWRKANPEKRRAIQVAYHRANRQKRSERNARYFAANKDAIKLRQRNWYKQNADRVKRKTREYLKAHPEVQRAVEHKRRVSRQENTPEGNHFTPEQWKELCAKAGRRCLACKKKRKLTVDHIEPLSKGGSNSLRNIQPLCGPCNCRKGTKAIDYRPTWMQA